MRRKTPQEKKVLSYARDCRNTYGESDKGSRKTIRRNKTTQNQAYRRKVNQVLSESGAIESEGAEIIDSKARSVPRGKWKKGSDLPLGLFIKLQADMRERREGRKLRGSLGESNLSSDFLSKLKKRK